MRTELFTVSRIFTESLYRIPDYQRGYSWKEEHLKDFWLDLEQLQSNAKHYTGVLTLEAVPHKTWGTWEDDRWIIESRRYTPYYVVDGQQRLTTVVILLQSILEKSMSDGVLNFTAVSDVRKKYIFDTKIEDSSRSYLFGYEKDNPSYEYLKRRIFLESSDVHLPEEETIYTKNLLAAKEFFLGKLTNADQKFLESLFTKVTQQLVFNVYEISSDIDVFVTFETMNNRGKPLSTLELLKNRLIFLSTKLPSGRKEQGPAKLRRAVNDAWKTTYHYLGKNDERELDDDVFLRTHLAIYYPSKLVKVDDNIEDDKDRTYPRFAMACEEFNRFLLQELFTPKRLLATGESEKVLPQIDHNFIYEYSQHLKSSIELYYKISTPADSGLSEVEKIYLERIGRLRGYEASPIMMAVYLLESSAQKRAKFLEKYERYLFCSSIGNHVPSNFRFRRNAIQPFVIAYLNKKNSIDELTQQYENFTVELFKEKSVVDKLHDWVKDGPGFYGWRSIKYFLYEYEISLQQKSKSSRVKLDWKDFSREEYRTDFETIEHIYPQRARAQYWIDRFSKYSTTQRRLLRNSLGNLLPLSRPKNSSLSNKSFLDKLGDHENKTGYKYGCFCENEVANLSDWGAQQILDRGVSLLDFLERRWQISVGDKSAKIKALGLGFLSN